MLSILREVTVSGTASSVRKMGRPDLGGKTGTTNDYTDAWFIGFNPKYTTGVWIGYDTRDSLGNKEFGARAALPVWMEYMSFALRNDKPKGWPPPPGIEFAGSPYSSRRSYGRSPASSPHFAPGRQLKQVSPVDAVSDPFSEGMGAYSPWFGPAAFGAFSHYDLIRVLSPRGKTMGFASFSQDEKGNLVLGDILPRGVGQEETERSSMIPFAPWARSKLPRRQPQFSR
jgi:penicillin-binding protein 1A